jgi:DNA gyrase subunit A
VKKEILLVTASGMAIRFKEDDVRPMGLVAAGVNGMKLEEKDEVVGMEILPADGEIFLLTNEGKAKRVDQKDFPVQGRYGKGVVAWDLPGKSTLAAVASGKANQVATIHMTKGAPKSTRLDAVAVRKRASAKGDLVAEVKPGESVTSVNVGWVLERFVAVQKVESGKKARKEERGKKKSAPAKKAPKPAAKAKPAKKPALKKKKK